MKLYKHYAEFDENDMLLWHVYELQTGHIVDSFFFEEDAIQRATEMEKGKAFAGFTPSFILRKVPIQTNINDAFAAEFS
jgi:hypothetical protein